MTPDSIDTLLDRAAKAARNDPTGEGEARWLAVTALHASTDRQVLERALAWSRDDDPLLRSLAADVLARLAWEDGYPFRGESEPALLRMLDDDETAVVASALHALGHLDLGDTEGLVRFATHDEANVRYALVCAIGGREHEAARRTLIQLSEDADSDVRDWATFGLGSMTDIDSPEIRDALASRLDDDDADTRCEAMLGLAERGDERAVPHIERELASDEVGQLAIDAAAALADPRFLPHLESLLACNPDEQSLQEAIARCRKSD